MKAISMLFLMAGLLTANPLAAQDPSAAEVEAFVREYPEALVYRAMARHAAGDAIGAVYELERYLELTPARDGDRATRARRHQARELMETVFFNAYPLALVYRGIAQYQDGDYRAAIGSWNRYVRIAGADADRESVRSLVRLAQREMERADVATAR